MRTRPIAIHWIAFSAALLLGAECSRDETPGSAEPVARPPRIEPDYSGVTIPPNIAPLNFVIHEKGRRYRVEIASDEGNPIAIRTGTPQVRIPQSRWRDLLSRNRGRKIRFTVSVLDSANRWIRFDSVVNAVAREDIDGTLVYRLIRPLYILWKNIGIRQRNLQNFGERTVLDNKPLDDGCFNCHSFLKNNPDNWSIHLRIAPGTGMLLNRGGTTVLVDTRTEFNKSHAAYPAWHPDGRHIAFSVNKVKQFFHETGDNRDVYDLASDLILYDADSNTVTSSPYVADPGRLETYPNWSPDGRQLYFCSAPAFDTSAVFDDNAYKKIRYDLARVDFDPSAAAFGKPETVLSAEKTGLSVTHPRVSPDGNTLLFCMSEYGNFSIYRPSSDLYLMDLRTREVKRLDGVNSDRSDSYHSWSSNGRWFVFSSKREDGIHARPYFSYFDGQGNVHKPFVLPQEDPSFYETCLMTFNVPELVSGPLPQRTRALVDAARASGRALKAKFVRPNLN